MNELSLFEKEETIDFNPLQIEQVRTEKYTEKPITTKIELKNNQLGGHPRTSDMKIRGQNQDYISVKELASELNVSGQTIRNSVKELFTDPSKLLWRVVNGGKSLFLSKEQATAIKLKLRTRNNLKDDSVIKQIGNDLEFFALLKQRENEQRLLDEYRDRRIAELTAENERMKPKEIVYDDFLSRDKFCNLRDGAAYLGISQTEFMDILKSKYIYKNNIGEYRAYAEYTDYFTLRPFARGTERTGQQLMLNLQGLEYFGNLLKMEIA